MPPHDALFKSAFERPAAAIALLRAALPAELARNFDLSSLEVVKGNFVKPTLRERFADLLFRVRAGEGDAYVHLLIEHKSRAERFTVIDLVESAVMIWQDSRIKNPNAATVPRVYPLVVHHGSKAWSQPRELHELLGGGETLAHDSAPFDPRYPVIFFDLGSAIDPESAIERIDDPIARCVLFLLMISRMADFVARLRGRGLSFVRVVWSLPNGQRLALQALEYVYCHLPEDFEPHEFDAMVGEHVHPDAEVQVRSMIDAVFEKGEALGKKKGLKEGLEQGLEQGLERGKFEAAVLALIRVLSMRFGDSAKAMRSRLESIRDVDALLRLTGVAVTAESLEAFARHVEQAD